MGLREYGPHGPGISTSHVIYAMHEVHACKESSPIDGLSPSQPFLYRKFLWKPKSTSKPTLVVIDWRSTRGLSSPYEVKREVEMDRQIPKLGFHFSLEDFSFSPAPTKDTSEKPRSVRVNGLHHLSKFVTSNFLQVRIFGPCTTGH